MTRNIVVSQTGVGNASRELRVEGLDKHGHTGYFVKQINDPSWSFVQTPHDIKSEFLDRTASPVLAPSQDRFYLGKLHRWRGPGVPDVAFLDFNPYASTGTVRVWINGFEYDLNLFMHRAKRSTFSPDVEFRGALEIPKALQVGFRGEQYIDVTVQYRNGDVTIKNHTWFPWFGTWLEMNLLSCSDL